MKVFEERYQNFSDPDIPRWVLVIFDIYCILHSYSISVWRFYLCAIPGTSQTFCLDAYSSIGSWSTEGLGSCCVCSFYYGSHYSSMGIVLFYLLRLEPFTSFHRQLQVFQSWCVYLWPGILWMVCQSLNIVRSILMVISWWILISSCHMYLISATCLFRLYHYLHLKYVV